MKINLAKVIREARTRGSSKSAEWGKVANDILVGCEVVSARYLTKEEAASLGWSCRPLMLIMHDGTVLYATTAQEEGDGATLIGQTDKGEPLAFPAMK